MIFSSKILIELIGYKIISKMDFIKSFSLISFSINLSSIEEKVYTIDIWWFIFFK